MTISNSYGKFGFPAMTNNALGNKATSKPTKSTKPAPESEFCD
jgi:hypothetical protein